MPMPYQMTNMTFRTCLKLATALDRRQRYTSSGYRFCK